MIIITHPACTEYEMKGHPERPERISETVSYLKKQKEISLTFETCSECEDSFLLQGHHQEHLERVKAGEDFDADTPAYPNIFQHAKRAVGGALMGLEFVKKGNPVFSLLRPPGHHATSNQAMGFCYFNQVAIAALEALKQGYQRVAIYDFDVHHGNGTEAIVRQREGIRFFSIHQSPCYPGTGLRSFDNCFNYPVSPMTPPEIYREILREALDELEKWKPDLILVSAGFDAYRGDPISNELMEEEDFQWMGEQIRKMNIPFLSLLEGGYSNDLPQLILAYLRGVVSE